MTNRTSVIQKKTSAGVLQVPRSLLPKSWKKAAGLLRGRKLPDPVKYQREIRKGWEKQPKQKRVSGIAARNSLPKMSRQAVNREITAYRSSH